MGYQNLDYFLTLCEHLHLRHAADALHVTPQYLSRYIIDLEKSYGVKLFHRRPTMTLTYEGELLLDAAKDIRLCEKNLESELQDHDPLKTRELRLGYCDESIERNLPDLLLSYRQHYPNVRVTVTENSFADLRSLLEDGHLDLCLGIHLPSEENLNILPLSQEKVYLLIADRLLRLHFSYDYPLCAERFHHGVKLNEFAQLPFLDNRSEPFLHQIASQYSAEFGIAFRPALSSSSTDALIDLCRKGLGILLCTGRYISYLNHAYTELGDYIYAFPVIDLPSNYYLDIAYAGSRHLPHYITDFVECSRAFFSQTLAVPSRKETFSL